MRFSIFTTLPPVGRSPDVVLKDFREQVVLAEELGFHAVWIGEHHFQPFGGGDLPNPQTRTLRNIERFGTEVMPHFRSDGVGPAADSA